MPVLPKLLGVRTMPSPKWCCQMRLTMTRAVRGLLSEAIHSAKCLRRQLVLATGGGAGNCGWALAATARTPGCINDPLLPGSPRWRKYDGSGSRLSSVTVRAVG